MHCSYFLIYNDMRVHGVTMEGLTLAEGELLIIAVRTPKAWMVILSVPFFQTYIRTTIARED